MLFDTLTGPVGPCDRDQWRTNLFSYLTDCIHISWPSHLSGFSGFAHRIRSVAPTFGYRLFQKSGQEGFSGEAFLFTGPVTSKSYILLNSISIRYITSALTYYTVCSVYSVSVAFWTFGCLLNFNRYTIYIVSIPPCGSSGCVLCVSNWFVPYTEVSTIFG